MYKKYFFLDQINLKKVLKTKSVKELAKQFESELGFPYQNMHACITFRINRYFSDEEKKLVKRERKPNKKTDQ